jgi:phage shock protein E
VLQNIRMKTPFLPIGILCVLSVLPAAWPADGPGIPNPLIDYNGFLRDASQVAKLRETRRVSEEEFARMAADPATIVLDARSREKYRLLHIRGAAHLSLPDMTAAELAKVIPAKDTRVLIYCNNNFQNEPAAFASKTATASLNIYTFNSLYGYGYTNVYELGPLIDIQKTKLEFEGEKIIR